MANPSKAGMARVAIALCALTLGALGVLAYLHSQRPITEFTVAVPGVPSAGGGTCYGCTPFDGLDLSDESVGVAAEAPPAGVFRGLVVASNVFPSGLRSARVTPWGYYLDFADGVVRFVADDGPWKALEPGLEPEWINAIVSHGAVDPAP